MNKPKTEHVLIRTPRAAGTVHLQIINDFGKSFDFTGYSYLRTRVTEGADSAENSMEEWVPTAELELYRRVMK